MLRITVSSEGSTTVLHVAGNLAADSVAELEKVCSSVAARIALDLSELRSADRLGLQTLLAIANRGAELRHGSTYLQLLLDREGRASVEERPERPEEK